MRSLFLFTAAVCLCLESSWANAATSTPSYRELEAVYDDGSSTYNFSSDNIVLSGVVINNPEDFTDKSTWSYGWWQTYVQSTTSGDYGGVALWDGYWGTGVDATLQALNLQYGDLVTVTAYSANDHLGKYNLTDDHNNGTIFSVAVTGHTNSVAATDIDLSKLYCSDGVSLFDMNRNEGCEYYQGALVHLTGLKLADSRQWAAALTSNDNVIEVTQKVDGKDYTFNMILGLGTESGLSGISDQQLTNMQNVGFDVTAILDQECEASPYTSGYRLWLTNADRLTVTPEPGTLVLLAAGALGLLVYAWRKRK